MLGSVGYMKHRKCLAEELANVSPISMQGSFGTNVHYWQITSIRCTSVPMRSLSRPEGKAAFPPRSSSSDN
ncbi:unnamed protein product [Nezara viridula]|uniref:Uncharacterized protein n=1 Tax=Nezara viridula TaxID=85310 RepID=A0A9P0E364_NEZVI|nr:unnamed protein product [Nezara viridula]